MKLVLPDFAERVFQENIAPEGIRNWLIKNNYGIPYPTSDEVILTKEQYLLLCQTPQGKITVPTYPLHAFHFVIDNPSILSNCAMDQRSDGECVKIEIEFFSEDSLTDNWLVLLRHHIRMGMGNAVTNYFYESLWEVSEVSSFTTTDVHESPCATCIIESTNLRAAYSQEALYKQMCAFRNLILGIQFCFVEKPQIFSVASNYSVFASNHKKEKLSKNRTVHIQKTIKILNTKDLEKTITGRQMLCNRWSVSGHYRIYKSGKKVWIAPYEKGSHRNDKSYPLSSKIYKEV